MPRATRSTKITIVEDETAIASQIALPETPAKPRAPLSDIDNPVESITIEEAMMADQLKGLKAAYKTAIGVKKNKKNKNKKKGKHHDLINKADFDEKIGHDGGFATEYAATEVGHQSLNSCEEEKSLTADMSHAALAPAFRTTRARLAATQTGQFDVPVTSGLHYRPGFHPGHLSFSSAIDSPSYSRFVQAWASNHCATPRNYRADRPMGTVCEIDHSTTTEAPAVVDNRYGDIEMMTPPTELRLAAVEDIQKTPSRSITTLEEVEKTCEKKKATELVDYDSEDSFIEQITSRSPAKPVSRIEDSVEALDQLEEAIEALDEATLAQHMVSPEKKKKVVPTSFNTRGVSPGDKNAVESKTTGKGTGYASLRIKSKPTLAAGAMKKMKSTSDMHDGAQACPVRPAVKAMPIATTKPILTKRPSSLLPPKLPVKSTKPPTRPTFELPGEAVARRLKEQREARILQRQSSVEVLSVPPPKIRSTKPPTVSTFELPGEALSRRKREAHEARLKAQEEEEKKRREFKAKPLRKSSAPGLIPRETITSRARKSQIGSPDLETATIAQPSGSLSVAKRGANIGAHRPSILATNLANTSSPRSPGPVTQAPARKASTTSGPSMSGLAMNRTVSASDTQMQRQRAKDIYKRDARAQEEHEREKREREAAAKKSREEAAERGRQASRDWAQKQKAKKAAEGDKGLSAGFGPGGQMGLQA